MGLIAAIILAVSSFVIDGSGNIKATSTTNANAKVIDGSGNTPVSASAKVIDGSGN